MLKDLRAADIAAGSAHDYDVCIVGSGAAGLTLAMAFEGSGMRVAVLEAGGLEFDWDSQDAYAGEIVGLPYNALNAVRLRYFGGTTNHWSGTCNPLPDRSFVRQAWIPHSGWPLEPSAVRPYYDRASSFLGFERAGWDPAEGWDMDLIARDFGDAPLPIDPEAFYDRAVVIEPIRMGKTLRQPLERSGNVDVVLHANVTDITTNETASHVTGLIARTPEGKTVVFGAKAFVLATGGIENARLLLNATSVQKEGLGNGHDLVGRFFGDHAGFVGGTLLATAPSLDVALYRVRGWRSTGLRVVKEVTPAAQQQFELMAASVSFLLQAHPTSSSLGYTSLRVLAREASRGNVPADLGTHLRNVVNDFDRLVDYGAGFLWEGRRLIDRQPVEQVDVDFHLEPAPNPDSRVLLGSERDAFGLRRVRLDWRLSEIDRHTVRWVANRFATAVAAQGLGRFQMLLDETDIDGQVKLNNHATGTTRMADDPREGVVDVDCRVHGIDNLFMASSSVFTTCGAGSPTFLIVALALRLADHLKRGIAA